MEILAKIKFTTSIMPRATHTIDGKRIAFFSEGWAHLKFEEHNSSLFSVFITSSQEIMYKDEEYEVIMQFFIGKKIHQHINIFVGKEFEGGYPNKMFFTGEILEIDESFKEQ